MTRAARSHLFHEIERMLSRYRVEPRDRRDLFDEPAELREPLD